MDDFLSRPEVRLATALVIGLVIGAEREQHAMTRGPDIAGLRTFAVVALLGGVSMLLGDAALVAALALGVGAAVLGSILVRGKRGADDASPSAPDPGLTTETALLLPFALGALALLAPLLALAGGIATAVILAFRQDLHGIVKRRVSSEELRDALILGAAALVVLPVVPDAPVDPIGVVNPFTIWRLAVVVMAITFGAHVTRRLLGARWGLAIAGLASGFVSSSATIAAMGAKAREDPAHVEPAIAAACASTVATFVQMVILVGTASPSLLASLAPSLGAGMAVAAGIAGVFAWRAARGPVPQTEIGRAIRVRSALTFALVVTAVAFVSALLQEGLGERGVVLGAAVAALADAHAAAASVATVHANGTFSPGLATSAVLVCLSTNSVTKVVLAVTSGPPRYWRPVAAGVVAVLSAAWLGLAAMITLG